MPAASRGTLEPDVMVLPEPNPRNRQTVALEPVPTPTEPRMRATEPLPPPTGDPATDARLEKLENSPFWFGESEPPESLPRPDPLPHTGTRTRHRYPRRRPAASLFALVTLALVASFFAWVSAEPFWLAVGHGTQGYATTTICTGSGVTQRCVGTFAAANGRFVASGVTLLGVETAQRATGAVASARMVSQDSHVAYLGDTGLLVELRWMLGFLLLVICGYGIAGLTGARRLENRQARRAALLASVAGPLVLLAGFLIATY